MGTTPTELPDPQSGGDAVTGSSDDERRQGHGASDPPEVAEIPSGAGDAEAAESGINWDALDAFPPEIPSPPELPGPPEETPEQQAARIATDKATSALVLGRIRRTSAVAYVVFAVVMLVWGGWRGLIGLTCSAVVTMINFLWLEEIVEAVLQPSPRLKAWRLSLRTLARFALLGVALSVAIFVARFNAVSVLLGFSVVVVGILGEALYSAISN
jgi:hypothetical protein